MTKIDEYLGSVQADLASRFARMRAVNTDPASKGAAAEEIAGDLLAKYLHAATPTYRRQIIDSEGGASDEVDLVFCNESQPDVHAELLLAEGVKYAIQVKSVLTDPELDRLLANARSVKALQRRLGANDAAVASEIAGSRFIDRIPYVGFAYESRLSFDALHERLARKCDGIAPELRPDALFVLGRGSLVNSLGQLVLRGEPVAGWIGIPDPSGVLLELLNYLLVHVPTPLHSGSALRPYLAKSLGRLKRQ